MTESNEKRKQQIDEAVMLLNNQLSNILMTFHENISKIVSDTGTTKQLAYTNLFASFKVSLDDLVVVAMQVTPDCISAYRNTRKQPAARTRQVLCYIASEMGYKDKDIAARIGSDRATVHVARHKVAESFAYNDMAFKKLYNQFLKHLGRYPNGEMIKDHYNIL